MKHALSIGGTGMLAESTHWLVREGYAVSVFARHADEFCHGNDLLKPFTVSWNGADKFIAAIDHALELPAHLALVWCHSSWHKLPLTIAHAISRTATTPFQFYLVLGSAVSDPARTNILEQIQSAFAEINHCELHLILLGFVLEGGHRRWLTNGEIAKGTISAIQSNAERTPIGVTRPWDTRP